MRTEVYARWRWLQGCVWALLLALAWPAQAARIPTASELMDWAENRYPQFFPGRQGNLVAEPYLYRHYPQTGNYIGVAGTRVFILGPVAGSGGLPVEVGDLSSFACDVFPASCQPGAYPSRALTLVVPASAGTSIDRLARDLAPMLQTRLGQAVTVRNVPGSTGVLGTQNVLGAAADGYTLLLQNMGLATTPSFFRSTSFRPLDDFEYLGLIAEAPMVLVGRSNLPPKNYAALAAWLAAFSNQASMGHAGVATSSNLCAIQFLALTRSTMVQVPYRGVAPMLTDLLGGQIDFACDEINTVANIGSAAATLTRFGLGSPGRTTLLGLGDLPTLSEQGLAGFDSQQWYGLYAPRGTAPDVVAHLNSALRQVLVDAEFIRRQQAVGLAVVPDARAGTQQHRERVAAEVARWAPLILANRQYVD